MSNEIYILYPEQRWVSHETVIGWAHDLRASEFQDDLWREESEDFDFDLDGWDKYIEKEIESLPELTFEEAMELLEERGEVTFTTQIR